MTRDVAVYWRNVADEDGSQVPRHWYSNARVIRSLEAGDRLWLIVSGSSTGASEPHAAYLAGVLGVGSIRDNEGSNAKYPADEFRVQVDVESTRSRRLDTPVLVDQIVRSPQHDAAAPIGRLLQMPRVISGETVAQLEAILDQPSG